jgi:hypothetical protein
MAIIASVVVSDYATSSVSYVIPITEVSYVDIVVSAFTDDSGLFRIDFDTTVVVDYSTLAFAKQLSSEVVIAQDLLGFSIAKTVQDSTIPVESLAFSLGTSALDSFTTADLLSKVFLKSLTDVTSTADTIVGRAFEKRLYDAATMEDLVGIPDGATFQFCKYLSDFPSIAEQLTKDISIALSESNVVQDQNYWQFSSVKSDAFALAETTALSLSTSLDDQLIVVETNSIYTYKTESDAITTADSGVLSAQNYCELSYFLEDYVGDYRQF